jgi:uncharacterized membrane protein YecN with MAPEG domain
MPALPITAITAALLGLFYIALSVRVIMARGRTGTSLGDGGGTIPIGEEQGAPLLVACRTHANFAEYVPLCLILLGLVEYQGTRHGVVLALAALLVLGRVLHPLGMGRKVPNPYRAGGVVLTFIHILAASVALLIHAAQAG